MFVTSLRATALAGVALAAVALPVQAGTDCCAPACAAPACASAPETTCAAPAMVTVQVNEWVPETYKTTRTSYRTESVEEKYTASKMECVQENYTAYRTECVAETRTRKCVFNRLVPETTDVTCTVYTCVPTVEQRTVNRVVVTCVPVTVMVKKCVDQGHYECREVEAHPLCNKVKRMCHRSSCCDPCPPCVPTKTVKVWCPNKVWIDVPCTRMQRVCNTVTETVNVTVNKLVPTTQVRKVTTYKCVPEEKEETYTVMVPRQVAVPATRTVARCVPYEATRMVARCVPFTEEVTATRMVCRTVEKQVPAGSNCCGITVSSGGVGGHRLFGRSHHKGCCN